MHTTNLRKVGGSVMVAVPPALLDILDLTVGTTVGLAVDNGRLIMEPTKRPSYTLEQLLAQCDSTAELTRDDSDWLNSSRVGEEIL
ncbi:antitoxin [Lampropedia puyangensis]|uniref:Antitoxin n=1 Tax=Lampropedia puyangensis TaxID=1330072 RepID=A0A4S8EV82_9BURK|nr:AbrB/MazE/SpoVT family DNA-binding domain-containing protein [Lampropedia puyangensis]THT98416.1 antitoxin [Lampropedia puyangensis]